jgi:uncharacterized protein (TIGR00725 family)
MAQQYVIGIMGPGEGASKEDIRIAYEIGKIVAQTGYTALTGGRNKGVMNAALQGAKEENGTTIAIIPGTDRTEVSNFADYVIFTGMGNARNSINVLSSHLIISVGEGPGTLSEIALAIKSGKPVIAFNLSSEAISVFERYSRRFKAFTKLDRNELIQYLQKV